MTSIADAERAALCDLLDALGPDAPTLCAGWDTRDLATHLMVRDREPKAWAGIAVPRLSRLARQAMDGHADQPYPEIVATVRAGAPKWSPVGLPGAKNLANLMEYIVHHEDVLRAQPDWRPRAVPTQLSDALWRTIRMAGRVTLSRAPVGVVLRRAGTEETVVGRKGTPSVTVTGDPVELALFVTGRQRVARVGLDGDEAAAEQLRTADFSM